MVGPPGRGVSHHRVDLTDARLGVSRPDDRSSVKNRNRGPVRRLRCLCIRDIRWPDPPRTSVGDIPVPADRVPADRERAGIGGRLRHVGGRVLQSGRSSCVRRGAPLLLVLYLAWLVSPALHQLHQDLERQARPCQPCPADDPGWRILSHPPDQPCSDPDHHHHPRPVHEEDHCLSCRLSGAAVAEIPFAGVPFVSIQATPSVPAQPVRAPLSPELLAMSPRAPPQLTSA